MTNTIPDIFSYLDFRIYLSDWFEAKKVENPRYSHRMFSRRIGQKSPSFLSDVIKGRRKLTMESTVAMGQVLKLDKPSFRFFQLLVDVRQATDDRQKKKMMVKILEWRKRRGGFSRLEGDTFKILSQWEYIAVYELMKRPDFKLDPAWIGRNIQPAISASNARTVVETLFSAGLVVKDSRGSVTPTYVGLQTPPIVSGIAVRNYHKAMLELAGQSISRFQSNRRHLLGTSVAIPSSKLPELKRRLAEMHQEIHAFCEEGDEAIDEVIQINFNMFPLSTQRKKST